VSVDPFIPRPGSTRVRTSLAILYPILTQGCKPDPNFRNFGAFYAFLSNIEPKDVHEALAESDWVTVMQEELHQFERNKVWRLEP